jgi:hypothetical protein
MYLAHIGVGWCEKFPTYQEAVDRARSFGLPPEVFVEINLRKGGRR